MATIDLGKIKIVWRGTYAGGTAYTPDDAVVQSGTSYICIANTTGNAPPNGTYWNVLAQAGTNGTDLGTTLTTQGDILIRDGSGLARLGYGTSGQALVTKGSGQNPVWESVGADFTPQFQASANSNQSIASVTSTRLAFDTEVFDSDNAFDNSSGQYTFTVPSGKGGKYVIYGQTRKNNFSGNRFFVQVKSVSPGKTIGTFENTHAGDAYPAVLWHRVEQLAAGQVVFCEVYHNDSGNRTLIGDNESTFFGMYRLTD